MDKKTAKHIVFVTSNLAKFPALSDMLPQVSSNWQLQFLSSTTSALELVNSGQCDVILVDSDLSSESGLELLDSIWRTHPHIIRFLCAKAPSEELMMKCIWNSHRLFTYAPEAVVVRDAIQRALDVQSWLCNKRVQPLVSRMRTFPSLPTLYFKVLKELESTHASVEKLAELVGSDLAITTKIIQVVNSAFYAQQRQISDVKEAIQILGFETLKSLVLGIQAIARLDKVKPLYFSADKIWRHGLAVATLARHLAQLECSDRLVAEEAFTAGLLHDIGKLVLATNLDDQYNGVLSLAQKNQIPLVEVELEVFGATHADTAAYLVAVWGLPRRVVEAIALHHTPKNSADAQFSPLTAVHIANVLVHEQSAEKEEFIKPSLDMEYLTRLGVHERVDVWRGAEQKQTQSHSRTDNRSPKESIKAPKTRESSPRPSNRPSLEFIAYLSGALALVAVLCWIMNWSATTGSASYRTSNSERAGKRNKALPAEVQSENKMAQQQAVSDEASAAPEPAGIQATSSPDQPAASNPPDSPKDGVPFVLSAIHYRPPRSGALINGRTVYEGDKIEGATIVGIEKDKVRIIGNKGERILKLQ
jgi:putative nucleotidyltransferase with HDIG domain